MKIKVITVATRETDGLKALQRSAKINGMDLTVLGLDQVWQGFGMKVILTRDYLRTLTGYTHFIFVDAFDTVFLKPVIEEYDQLIFSAEKQCWPDPEKKESFSFAVLDWKYLNSGSYISPIKLFMDLTDKYPIQFSDDDQRYFTNIFLKERGEIGSDKDMSSEINILLDWNCKIFQSYAFQSPGDFTTTDKFINNITQTQPAIIHFNGKCAEKKIYNMAKYNSLDEMKTVWADRPEVHQEIHETFIEKVNEIPELKEHRDFVEQNIFGFGERSFHWLWYLVIKEMPEKFTFLEIGVLKGQTLSLCEILAKMQGKKAKRYGVTPLSTEGGVWESDYKRDIEFIHDKFNLAKDYTILNGLSQDENIIKQASKLKLDVLYIDGSHEKKDVDLDLINYTPLVKSGGYLVIDDAANHMHMPFGYFQGIQAVTVSLREWEQTEAAKDFTFLFNVVHNMVYKKN